MNLIIFGDSMIQGLWDEEGGWGSRIKQEIYSKHLNRGEPWKDYNIVYLRGSSSDTSEELKRRIYEELDDAKQNSSGTFKVIFSIGINDCAIKNGENEVSLSDYRENVNKIINESEELAEQVIAVGLTPIDESKLDGKGNTSKYLNSDIKKYNSTLEEICKEREIKFINIFNKLNDSNWRNCLFDGLHPNSEGHQRIYEEVRDPLFEEIELDLNRE